MSWERDIRLTTVLCDIVVHLDIVSTTAATWPFSFYVPCQSRVLVVDEKAQAFPVAVRVASAVRNRQIVCDCVSGGGELLVEVGSYAIAVTPAKPRSAGTAAEVTSEESVARPRAATCRRCMLGKAYVQTKLEKGESPKEELEDSRK
ncbi:hypothetical protein KC315_g19 [Hortaea werneckii]|nr:hypothetical protein KC315_g19 [Hortaea werneckii]